MTGRWFAYVSILIWSLMIPGLAAAQAQREPQPPVTLVADVIEIAEDARITATGNVEIFSGNRSLRARTLSYDRTNDRISMTGPIVLQEGEDTLVFADSAEIDPDLRDGVMSGARVVLRRQLQIAAAELRRRNGRFSDMEAVVASSCQVCSASEQPLWEIRARRMIHDQQEAQIWFYDARFRIAGLPVFYLPAFRIPDGTQDRLTGFLTPRVRTTTQLGPGLKLPYFITLGRSADLTLTPYVSTEYTRTLEARFRRMFASGEVEVEGAVSRDSIIEGDMRGYLFGEGRFDMRRGFELNFNVETASDDPYLQDYDYSGKDRLDSAIGIWRTGRGERIEARTIYYQSLRADEVNDRSPTFLGDLQWNRRWQFLPVGGWLDFDLVGRGHMRPSTENVDGRDMSQMRATLAWSRRWTGAGGMRINADLVTNGDVKYIGHDDRFEDVQTAVTPTGAVEIGWPLAATGSAGARYLIEPVMQLAWTARDSIDSPNDDSTLVAFDTGNLLALNRFPGLDRYEEGARANLALRWTRLDPDGWSLGVTLGKVYRNHRVGQFPLGTGLAGPVSDWMAQTDLDFANNLMLRNLLLLDSGFEATTNETRLSWQGGGLALASSYVWQRADRALVLDDDLSELSLDAAYDINRSWSAGVDLRRDLAAGRTNRAELGLTWRNECVRVDFSATRRFRATEDREPTTSYGLSVTLAGFGGNEPQSSRIQQCAGQG